MVKEQNTEDRIVDAAKKVFINKGMDGARMQEIANEAGINKALLHYYFRTKNKLFEKVFSLVFGDVLHVIEQAVTKETDFEQFLENFIRQYIRLLKNKPFIPQFVIHELNRKPERIVAQIQSKNVIKEQMFSIIERAVEKKEIRQIQPVHLVTNILALCIFPFVAKPMVKGLALDDDEKKYKQYINERPDEVVAFVKQAVLLR
ncbi:MAG: TetR/AcrR family transcriptional regulator [Bacteroidetes bacterium]|nr:MAG: TetR/AcrR family transcriptional regulator [Bacteroidota bacterium]RLD43085.1 MAG: TetR/AcrR family transcriptional regulator [Bacteroidota bacterium]